uniref:Uncharacterized protein n=1 Tax=Phlebotomus papatasi TaxID=29031 RepID=A0A1B0DBM8_PHLPP
MGLRNSENNTKYSSHQVFTTAQEDLLVEYLLKSSKLQYRLTIDGLRELAYSFASRLNRKMPPNWVKEQKAGKEWGISFIKRHGCLSLRKPENTSIARNLNFTKEHIEWFYQNLEIVMNKYNFHDKPEMIWNIDESGISTVLQAPKVLAAAGVKQVGQMVSNERGEQVTIVGIVNAAGGKTPPIYIFPRKRAKEEWMDGSPEGAISIFNGSGWMDKDGFLTTLKHIREHTAATKENPILILLDNHSSHTSLEVIIYCRENGIHMITFPPHTTHRCQPLDVAIFGPFKGRCKTEFNKWIAANPGKRITLHNVVKISAKAFSNSFSMSNIISGFLKTGIFPFDREALSADLDNLAEVITATDSCTVSQKEDSKPAISLVETKMS